VVPPLDEGASLVRDLIREKDYILLIYREQPGFLIFLDCGSRISL